MTEAGLRGPEGDLRVIWGPVWGVVWRSILRSILVISEVNIRPFLDPISETSSFTGNCLHLAVGRAYGQIKVKYGSWEGIW